MDIGCDCLVYSYISGWVCAGYVVVCVSLSSKYKKEVVYGKTRQGKGNGMLWEDGNVC